MFRTEHSTIRIQCYYVYSCNIFIISSWRRKSAPQAPDSLKVTVFDENKNSIDAPQARGDLLYFYRSLTGNNFLRRLAECIADDISKFAEKNNLSGDLAQQIDRHLRGCEPDESGKRPAKLTPKERAWCSSFNQENPTLDSDADLKVRLGNLLAQDLVRKTSSSKTKQRTKPAEKVRACATRKNKNKN